MANASIDAVLVMMDHPPPLNEKVPLFNHKSTMYGVTITFHIIAWFVVFARLHTRLFVVQKPGIDDVLVVLAAIFNLVSVVGFLGGASHGLGHHLLDVYQYIGDTMKWFYTANAGYHTTTVFIKISLLCQYLRMFEIGIRRKFCIVLLCIVIVWGSVFSFMAWFPCFPVRGFWDRSMTPQPKCYGFGYRTIKEAKYLILVFALSNMLLDIIVFLIPLSEYFRPSLRKKEVVAMSGLFFFAFLAITMAVVRVCAAWRHSHLPVDTFDFTWWYPQVLIISSLEIDFAIMSVSMPIFWPTVAASWSQIFVTQEVQVTSHKRLASSADCLEMGRSNSIKSMGSTEGLTTDMTNKQKSYYNRHDS